MRRCILIFILVLLLSTIAFAENRHPFDVGMEALDKKNYKEATVNFRIASEDDPDDIGFRFYYALALYYEGELGSSKSEFEKIVSSSKDSPWGRSAIAYIKNIDLGIYAPNPGKDYSGYLSFSFDNDDNVTYTPFAMADGYDNRASSAFSFAYKPTLFSYKPLSFSINTFRTLYERNQTYNERGWGGDLGMNIPFFMGSFLSLSYGNKNYYKEAEAPYYTNSYIESGLSFKAFHGEQAWTTIFLNGSNILYTDPSYEAYNGYDTNFGVRQNLNRVIYVQYDYRYSDANSIDYVSKSDEYMFGATIPLPGMHKLYISQKYINKHYMNIDSVGGIRRHDTAYVYDFYGSRELFRGLTLGLRYTMTNYSSNLDESLTALSYGSYRGSVFSLSISYNF